ASVSHTGVGNNNAVNNGNVGELPYSPTGQPYQCYVIYRDYGDVVTSSTPGVTVAIKNNGDGTVTITYTGNLYSSDTVNGTYTKVAGASSPFPVNPTTSGKTSTFYRAGP